MKKALLLIGILVVVLATGTLVSASEEVIIDNPSVTFVGTWTTASSATNKYGSNYQYCNQSASTLRTGTYTATLVNTASDWQVSTWYPTVSSSTTSAEFTIHHAGGDTTVAVNQTTNRGIWFSLGTYTMNSGSANYVRISNYHASLTSRVVADAIRFYSATAGDTTPPVITNVSASPGSSTATITWTTDEPATSQVEYGTTPSYGQQTAEDPTLVTSHTVNLTGLLTSQQYNYRVKSKDAAQNQAVSANYTFNTAPPPPEYRAIWANTWNAGILNAAGVTTWVNTCKNANYNMLVPEIRKCGDAYYVSHPLDCPYCTANVAPVGTTKYHLEHRATNIGDPEPYDPLQDMIDKAHAEGIQVNAWIVAYRIMNNTWTVPSDHVWATHGAGATPTEKDWTMRKSDQTYADGSNWNLDPGVPAVQDYICKVVMDITRNYDIDGFNYDYIRYPSGYYWGYNQITRQRFYDKYGYWPPTSTADANWNVWATFLRQQVTDLVKKCYLEIMAVRPNVNHNVDTVGWSGGNPVTDFTATRQYKEVYQDSEAWMNQHIIDSNILMNYKREYDTAQAPDYDLWTDWLAQIQTQSGRHSIDGQACYLNSIADSAHQMIVARQHEVGICNYDYLTTNKDGQPASDFFTYIKNNVYQDPAPIPDMPWKSNPTTGIVFGTVTNAAKPNNAIYLNWVNEATVTATGPVTRNTATDGTGTYGFLDLPPGIYSISVSKTGFSTRTYTNQVLAAGQVLREDFDLGTTTISSPSGTVAGGWSIISLPLEPVAPNPETVFSGISIDGNLFRWDNPTRSFIGYDMWTPGTFGNCTVNDGYYLYSSGPATISYSALGGTAAQHDIPISTAGWAIVGCPYLSDRWWADTQVTKSGETVSMTTAARDRGWLNSVGWWWDNSTQSLRSLGLPDDFPASEYLQPWHGYWVETYYDNVTLNLR